MKILKITSWTISPYPQHQTIVDNLFLNCSYVQNPIITMDITIGAYIPILLYIPPVLIPKHIHNLFILYKYKDFYSILYKLLYTFSDKNTMKANLCKIKETFPKNKVTYKTHEEENFLCH